MKKSHKNEENIITSAFSLTISTLIVKLLGVIYKIPLAQFLSEEGMGYFNSAYTVYTLFYILCTAGVPKAIMIFISERSVGEEKIVRVGMRIFLLLGITITLSFLLFAKPLAILVGNSGAYATMVAIAPSIFFISLSGVIRGYLSANLRFIHVAASQITEGITKLVFGLIFAIAATQLGSSYVMISAFTTLGVTFGSFAGLMHLLTVSKISIPGHKSEQITKFEERLIIKRIFSVSIPITVSAAVMSMTGIVDLAMIMRRLKDVGYTETEAVSLYGNFTTLAVPFFNLAISLITPISIAFLPIFTRAHATGQDLKFKSSISSSLELTALLSAPIVIGTLVYSEEILGLLFGNIGIKVGSELLRLLIFGVSFMSLLLILNSALEAQGSVKIPLISMSIGSVFKIIISYLLIGDARYGISGAPIGTVISYAVALAVSLIIFTKRLGYFPPIIRTSIPAYLCAFCAVFISTIPYRLMENRLPATFKTLISIFICGVLYVLLCLIFGVFSKEKLAQVSKYTKAG